MLENDILPEKYRILDEAKRLKGAPKLPEKLMTFGQYEFKIAFKEYFEALHTKTKSTKRI